MKNARIYTPQKAEAGSVIVTDGRDIAYIGDEAGAEAYIAGGKTGAGEEVKTYDLAGKTVLPGFIDAHTHPGICAESAWHVKLPWTEDPQVVLDFIGEYAKVHSKEEVPFLYFEYYPTSMFGKEGPKKEMLDAVVSDRPVLCQDFGEHLSWVNSKMLELMGVDRDTPDPTELEIFVRDEDGEPTGWVRERAWAHFLDRMYDAIGWRQPVASSEEMLAPVMDFFRDSGITAMFDGVIETDELIKTIYDMDRAGRLYTYYDGSVRFWHYADLPGKIEKLREYQRLYTTDHIKFNTMKLFLDGTNETGNAASIEELNDSPGNYGEIMMEEEELVDCFLLCNREGLDLHIHMVGDRAFRTACDAVEKAQALAAGAGEAWVCRPVFAHCESVHPSDMGRPAGLGIYVNWTCHWSGGYFGDEALNFYSREKWNGMYQFNPMIDSGANVSYSSDVVTYYELHRAAPFFGMQVAATRVDPEFPLDPEKYPGSMRPEASAKLGIRDLIEGYTEAGARQLRWDDKLGSIEAGKIANLVIVDRDPCEVPPEELKDVRIEAVMFDGKVVSGKL